MAFRLQEIIHKYEVGAGNRLVKLALALIAMVGLAVLYDAVAFRHLATQEGMDAAQLARNISEGRGMTTGFIRPFSMYLLKRKHAESQPQPIVAGKVSTNAAVASGDAACLKKPHPDLANAPVYPLLLAGALKLNPFGYPDLTAGKNFTIYKPDLWIAVFNQFLFLLAVGLVFRLARKLFDDPVAWVSAAVFLGTELFWRFSVSGLSTMLLVVIFLGLFSLLAWLEPAAREGNRSQASLIAMAASAGVLVGIAALTRYSFGWLIIPLLVWLALLPGQNRIGLVLAGLMAFAVVLTPWVVRNYNLSGTPFGTAGFAIVQNTSKFSGHELERSLNPDLSNIDSGEYLRKLFTNTREIIKTDLPKLGGNWVSAFFLVGLLVPFRNPTLGRLRWFLVACLFCLVVVQALGQTGLTEDSPEINSENLLPVLVPLVLIFGVSLLFVLLDQVKLPSFGYRYLVFGIFYAVACAPLLFVFLAPHPSPIAYPPYYPPWIQEKASYATESELIMADIPWAVAWYGGHRNSVWLTLKYKSGATEKLRNDFYEINDYEKPVRSLYLSAITLKNFETKSLWNWVREEGKEEGWDNFVLGTFLKREVPTGFPLKKAPEGLMPEIFLTDSERVRKKTLQSSE